jgi:MotA/TolQ/ExbB proton channel family
MNNKALYVIVFIMIDLLILNGLWHLGVFSAIATDKSFITHFIIAIYMAANVLMAYLVYNPTSDSLNKLLNWIPSCLTSLGLLGTVVGMYTLFHSVFDGFDFQTGDIGPVIKQLTTGFSTATMTTITGIATTIMLTLKFVWFNKVDDNEGN